MLAPPAQIVLLQWAAALLSLLAGAAAALPCIACLTLILGRREQPALCLFGARVLVGLGLCLVPAGPLAAVAEFCAIIRQMTLAGQPWAMPSLAAPGMLPYSTSLALWLTGALAAWLALRRLRAADAGGAIPASAICLTGLAALGFFAVFFCRHWPFAALPEGMSAAQAVMAVLQNALHLYFAALGPAGILALLCLSRVEKSPRFTAFPGEAARWSCRWCALWAALGHIPLCLSRLGVVLGYALRGEMPPWLLPQCGALAFLVAAICCFVVLVARPASPRGRHLPLIGFLLTAAGESLPFFLRLTARL